MLGLGPTELIIILVLVVIVFGVGRLPEVGSALGRGIREFRTSVRDEAASDDDAEATRGPSSKA